MGGREIATSPPKKLSPLLHVSCGLLTQLAAFGFRFPSSAPTKRTPRGVFFVGVDDGLIELAQLRAPKIYAPFCTLYAGWLTQLAAFGFRFPSSAPKEKGCKCANVIKLRNHERLSHRESWRRRATEREFYFQIPLRHAVACHLPQSGRLRFCSLNDIALRVAPLFERSGG